MKFVVIERIVGLIGTIQSVVVVVVYWWIRAMSIGLRAEIGTFAVTVVVVVYFLLIQNLFEMIGQ